MKPLSQKIKRFSGREMYFSRFFLTWSWRELPGKGQRLQGDQEVWRLLRAGRQEGTCGKKLLQPGARKLLKRTHVFVTWTSIDWMTDLTLCLPHSLKKVQRRNCKRLTYLPHRLQLTDWLVYLLINWLIYWLIYRLIGLFIDKLIDWMIDSRVCHVDSKVKGSSQNEVNLIPSVAVPVKGWPFCWKDLNTLI